MITDVDDIINKLRKHANNGKQNKNIVVSKISLVRIVDYIDKLEDENFLLKVVATRDININLKGDK